MPDLSGQNRAFRLVWLMRVSSVLLLAVAAGLYWQSQASVHSSASPVKGWLDSLVSSDVRETASPRQASPSASTTSLKSPSRRGTTDSAAGNFWLSSADAEQRRQRAQCDELAEAMERIAGVQHARVFVNVAAANGFQSSTAQASVLVEPQAGGHLPRSLVETVRRLVCGAVAGLAPEKIAVIDARSGRVLDLPTGLTAQAVTALDEAGLRQASNVRARISEGLAGMEGVRVEVWPTGQPSDEQLAGFVMKDGPASDRRGDESSTGGSERTQALTWHLAARVVVPGEEVSRREPQAAESPEAWQQAQDRLVAGLRAKVSQAAPTILPEEIAVEVVPPVQLPKSSVRMAAPHLMVGLVICALLAGYAWGRPIRRPAEA